MATVTYKTTQKPEVQKRVLKALTWIGPRMTSYAEIAGDAECTSSDCRYALLDLIEKGFVARTKVKGYEGTARGNRYTYTVTEEGKEWMDKPLSKTEKAYTELFE